MVDAQELELIRRCQSGEQRAQEELILAVQDTVYYHCKKCCGTRNGPWTPPRRC